MSQDAPNGAGVGQGSTQPEKTRHRAGISPELAREGRRQWEAAASAAQRARRWYSWHACYSWVDRRAL